MDFNDRITYTGAVHAAVKAVASSHLEQGMTLSSVRENVGQLLSNMMNDNKINTIDATSILEDVETLCSEYGNILFDTVANALDDAAASDNIEVSQLARKAIRAKNHYEYAIKELRTKIKPDGMMKYAVADVQTAYSKTFNVPEEHQHVMELIKSRPDCMRLTVSSKK